jgi:phenylalanine-4-hydroxylase
MEFTEEQHKTWETLYSRCLPIVRKHACQEYLAGFEMLELPPAEIPSIEFLNEHITPATGWRTVRTNIRYSDAVEWYNQFNQKNFLVTDYMREPHELEFTPEPDMFHDIFGHLPFMMLPEFAAIQELFAPAFLRAQTDIQREHIKRLAWYSTEFGIKLEKGEIKMFGAGLLSSSAEMEKVAAGQTPIHPFKVQAIIEHEKSVWDFNSQLFAFETLAELKAELQEYFAAI